MSANQVPIIPTLLVFTLLLTTCTVSAQQCNVYLPNADNIVVMDTEQRGDGGGWQFESILPGYFGSGYLAYKPWSSFGGTERPPNSVYDQRIKSYFFTVNVTGQYRVVVHSAAPQHTEHNDLWMSLPESGAVKKRFGHVSELTWPVWKNMMGELQLGEEHWFKLYQNDGGWSWNWGGKTVDHNGHDVISRQMNADGTWYSVRIAGRSTKFLVDRISLYLCEGDECDNNSERFKMATEWYGPQQSQCI